MGRSGVFGGTIGLKGANQKCSYHIDFRHRLPKKRPFDRFHGFDPSQDGAEIFDSPEIVAVHLIGKTVRSRYLLGVESLSSTAQVAPRRCVQCRTVVLNCF